MSDDFNKVFQRGVSIINVADQAQGIELAFKILCERVDKKTALFLSGGSTPKDLYEKIAQKKRIIPGAIAQIDERFGQPYHTNSNQLMIKNTGLEKYANMSGVPAYWILDDRSRVETAKVYDTLVRKLFGIFTKNIGIFGIGEDGHTAGIPSRKISSFKYDTNKLVTDYDDKSGGYGERVTMTFAALEKLDLLIILVFGNSKRQALLQMFEDGSEIEIPARFYTRADIAKKTLLITDQTI